MKRIMFACLASCVVVATAATGPNAKEVRQLLAQLKDRDIAVRQTAQRELTRLGATDGETVPVLLTAIADDNEEVRQVVSAALGKIGAPAVPALTKLLDDGTALERRQAVLALNRIGAGAKPAGVPSAAVPVAVTGVLIVMPESLGPVDRSERESGPVTFKG